MFVLMARGHNKYKVNLRDIRRVYKREREILLPIPHFEKSFSGLRTDSNSYTSPWARPFSNEKFDHF